MLSVNSRLLAIVAFAGTMFVPAFAQQVQPVPVTLWVADQSGAGVPGAQVKLVPSPSDLPAESHSDSDGILAVELRPGSYRVSVNSNGFLPLTKQIEVESAKAQAFQFALNVPNVRTDYFAGSPLVIGTEVSGGNHRILPSTQRSYQQSWEFGYDR